jgi:hypothetical protein
MMPPKGRSHMGLVDEGKRKEEVAVRVDDVDKSEDTRR